MHHPLRLRLYVKACFCHLTGIAPAPILGVAVNISRPGPGILLDTHYMDQLRHRRLPADCVRHQNPQACRLGFHHSPRQPLKAGRVYKIIHGLIIITDIAVVSQKINPIPYTQLFCQLPGSIHAAPFSQQKKHILPFPAFPFFPGRSPSPYKGGKNPQQIFMVFGIMEPPHMANHIFTGYPKLPAHPLPDLFPIGKRPAVNRIGNKNSPALPYCLFPKYRNASQLRAGKKIICLLGQIPSQPPGQTPL
ncbi:hypothetical protein IMSAGC019_03364 [Lachnospiraceae bacterium]|nr:hypothetical protein IMSAGC019_03364 [Lachnospiraceae bacterium]